MPGQIDYNALGQAIDTTWGRSSTPLTSSTSVKIQIVGDGMLKVNYLSTVVFRSNRELQYVKNRHADEATTIVNKTLDSVKKKYRELTGTSINVKEEAADDSVEVIGLAVHNVQKRAFYRRTSMFSIA